MQNDKEGDNAVLNALNEAKSVSDVNYSFELIDDTHWRCLCGQTNHVMDSFCTSCSEPRPDSFAPHHTGRNENPVGIVDGALSESNSSESIDKDIADDRLGQDPAETTGFVAVPVATPAPVEKTVSTQFSTVDSDRFEDQGFKFNKKILVGCLISIFVVFALYHVMSDDKQAGRGAGSRTPARTYSAESTRNSSKEKQETSTGSYLSNNERNVKTELSLGGLDLGVTVDDMHRILGKENSTKSEGEHKFYYYNGLDVGCMGAVVHSLVSDTPNYNTKRGIHVGSSFKDITSAYGNDYSSFSYGGLNMYEYTYRSLTGEDGILRFAVNNNSIVEYISVRIPDKPKVDVEAAKKAFRDYHAAITNHKLREAYNMLTFDRQNQMGIYENYSKGFKDTLLSEVEQLSVRTVNNGSVVLDFRLKAHDRYQKNKIKEQIFSGFVTMIYENGKWMIDSGETQKISERILY